MIMLIEQLHSNNQYRIETLFLAGSLADRYASLCCKSKVSLPCLLELSVTSLLIAVKIEEHGEPSFDRMIDLVMEIHEVKFEKKRLLKLEEKMLRAFDFSLRRASSVDFLSRFVRLFGLESETIKQEHSDQVIFLASTYCRFMMRESLFLQFKSSQIAAASLLFAINLCQSTVV